MINRNSGRSQPMIMLGFVPEDQHRRPCLFTACPEMGDATCLAAILLLTSYDPMM